MDSTKKNSQTGEGQAQVASSVSMSDILNLVERLELQRQEAETRRREEDLHREKRRQKEFQDLLVLTMERQTSAHERERRELAEAERIAREHEAGTRRRERELDKKGKVPPFTPLEGRW